MCYAAVLKHVWCLQLQEAPQRREARLPDSVLRRYHCAGERPYACMAVTKQCLAGAGCGKQDIIVATDPAHELAADHPNPRLCTAARGTSTWSNSLWASFSPCAHGSVADRHSPSCAPAGGHLLRCGCWHREGALHEHCHAGVSCEQGRMESSSSVYSGQHVAAEWRKVASNRTGL